jgi:hypothetical protein
MTMIVPKARESGMLRRGSFTSPAVKVMLFHASAENREPVCDTHSAMNRPKAVSTDTPGPIGSNPRGVQRSPKFIWTAFAFHPTTIPTTTSPMSAPVLATVKTFWIDFPYLMPRVFVQVSPAMRTMPVSWAVDSDSA